jgi:hypothetical protein
MSASSLDSSAAAVSADASFTIGVVVELLEVAVSAAIVEVGLDENISASRDAFGVELANIAEVVLEESISASREAPDVDSASNPKAEVVLKMAVELSNCTCPVADAITPVSCIASTEVAVSTPPSAAVEDSTLSKTYPVEIAAERVALGSKTSAS